MNMKKLILATSLGLLALTASATPADPLAGLAAGPLIIKMTGESATNFNIDANPSLFNTGLQNTWGMGIISQITDKNNLWWNSTPTDVLFYTITGISDQLIYGSGGNTVVDSVGTSAAHGGDGLIHLNLYLEPSLMGLGCLASATCLSGTNPFTAATPYLAMTFKTGVDLSNMSAMLYQTLTANNATGAGEGSFFASVVGGTNAAEWASYGGQDITGNFTVSPINTTTCTATDGSCFSSKINDPITTNPVPEPASLAMVGLGLAALARLRRRKS